MLAEKIKSLPDPLSLPLTWDHGRRPATGNASWSLPIEIVVYDRHAARQRPSKENTVSVGGAVAV